MATVLSALIQRGAIPQPDAAANMGTDPGRHIYGKVIRVSH
jgi:hypothetical protein